MFFDRWATAIASAAAVAAALFFYLTYPEPEPDAIETGDSVLFLVEALTVGVIFAVALAVCLVLSRWKN